MEARAKLPHRVVRAFTGQILVNYEWRPVPAGCDDEALRLENSGFLELRTSSEQSPLLEVLYDATPSAVALAEQFDIDLAFIAGSGAGGRILVSDVQAALDEEE